MHIIGLIFAWIVAIGIIFIGLRYVAMSETNARGFGLPQLLEGDRRGWWQVKGVRDIVCGLVIIVAAFAAPTQLWWLILVLSLIPLGDVTIILANRGRKSAAFGIHGTTAVVMIISSRLLFPA